MKVLSVMSSACARAAWVALCWFSMSTAQAALFEDDEARKAILDLRQKVDATQTLHAEELRKAGEENAQLRRSVLELSNQIETLRNELARMRGLDEQLARELTDVQRGQKDLIQGVEDRLKKFEPVKVSVDGQDFLAQPAEMREFESALATFRKGEFASAEKALAAFVGRFSTSGYQPSALFWLGNTYYAQRDYKEAMVSFRKLIAAEPAHVRAPEAMLSIANCQVELKEPKAARKTLEELSKTYPRSEAALLGKERLAKLK